MYMKFWSEIFKVKSSTGKIIWKWIVDKHRLRTCWPDWALRGDDLIAGSCEHEN
jgi:hypothetical protein